MDYSISRRRRPHRPALAIALCLMLAAAGSANAAPTVDWQLNLRPDILGRAYPRNSAFDPIVATDPLDASRIAVSYHWKPKNIGCGFAPGLRISVDGGQSWAEADRRPWAGSGRQPNWHATIAWGPGPEPGSTRLYWANTTVASCSFTDHRLSIAWSDDLGATWSPLFVYHGAQATSAGGYPDITVDRDPASPNYGAVYAAINWFPDSQEPGYRVLGSRDFGSTWSAHEIPPLAAPAGYPFSYRIGYRLRSAPDGSLYATFCQRDRTSSGGATGRLAFGMARLLLEPKTGALTGGAPTLARVVAKNSYSLSLRGAPGSRDWQALGSCWSHGIDVDAGGTVHLAIASYRTKPPPGEPRGVILFGRSSDHGTSWDWQRLPAAAEHGGRRQSAYRPTLVVSGSTVFVGFHLMTEVALGSSISAATSVAVAYSVSYDGGGTFAAPVEIADARWDPDWLDYSRNGPGIRDRAALSADGLVVYTWGDGRHAAAKPDARWGRSAVYLAAISPGAP